MSIIDSLVINVASNAIYDAIVKFSKKIKDKKQSAELISKVQKWLSDCEKKYDNCIITSSSFNKYVEYHWSFDELVQYACIEISQNKTVDEFIDLKTKECKTFIISTHRKVEPFDEHLIRDTFYKLFNIIRDWYINGLDKETQCTIKAVIGSMEYDRYRFDILSDKVDDVKNSVKFISESLKNKERIIDKAKLDHHFSYVTNVINDALAEYDGEVAYYLELLKEFKIDNVTYWKMELIDYLHEYLESNTLINECVGFVQGRNTYDVVKTFVHEKLKKAKLQNIGKLSRRLEKTCNTVSLITGGSGSGKTRVLYELAKSALIQSNENLIVLIDVKNQHTDIIDLKVIILKYLNKALNYDYQSLDEIENCMFYSLSNMPRILVYIDNIDWLIHKKKDIQTYLIDSIMDMSKYEYVKFIITVHSNSLDAIMSSCKFINNYCNFLDENKYMFATCALDMDVFNSKFRVGYKITNDYGITIDTSIPTMQDLPYAISIHNPLAAHIVGKLYSNSDISEAIGIYGNIYECMANGVTKQMSDSGIDINEINKSLIVLLNIIILSNKRSFSLNELGTIPINIFENFHLLSCNTKTESNPKSFNYMAEDKMYELSFIQYWAYKLIQYLRNITNKFDCVLAVKLNSLISETMPVLIEEYDSQKENEQNGASEYIDMVFKTGLMNQLMLCAIRSRYIIKDIVVDKLKNNVTINNFSDAFTIVYYLFYSCIGVENMAQIILKFQYDLSEHDVLIMLKRAFDKHISSISSIKKMKKVIKYLIPCIDKSVSYICGTSCGEQMAELYKEYSIEDTIDDLYNFYDIYSKEIDEMLSEIYADNQSFLFIDWTLRTLIEKSIIDNGLKKTFYKIKRLGLFDNVKNINFSAFVRRNMSCAAGNIYLRFPTDNLHQEYLDIVNELTNQKSRIYKMFAFHFISNSLPDDRNEFLRIDYDLRDPLRKLSNDIKMQSFFSEGARKSFVKRNLQKSEIS